MKRPPFLISFEDVTEEPAQGPEEVFGFSRALGAAAGLAAIGLHRVRLPPGHRTSLPHAEEKEEEFVLVLDGECDAWIDGHLYPMRAGDLAAFPSGTGICHTFLNNGTRECTLLVGGERTKPGNRYFYPKNPEMRAKISDDEWWSDPPARERGPHPGKPDRPA